MGGGGVDGTRDHPVIVALYIYIEIDNTRCIHIYIIIYYYNTEHHVHHNMHFPGANIVILIRSPTCTIFALAT